jgi:hypothetical protein
MATAAKVVQPIPIFLAYLILRHPELQSGDVLLFYVSFSQLLFFHTFLSARFLGDALIKLYKTL